MLCDIVKHILKSRRSCLGRSKHESDTLVNDNLLLSLVKFILKQYGEEVILLLITRVDKFFSSFLYNISDKLFKGFIVTSHFFLHFGQEIIVEERKEDMRGPELSVEEL